MRYFIAIFVGALCALNALIIDEAKLLNPNVLSKLETMSSELKEKTNINAHLLTSTNPNNLSLKELASTKFELSGEYAILVLVPKKIDEKTGKVDIILSNPDLLDKDAVLSPMPNTGTILPLLASKRDDIYNAALLNGFADIAERIALSKGVELQSAIGSSNKTTLTWIRYLLYGFLLFAIIVFVTKSLRKKSRIPSNN